MNVDNPENEKDPALTKLEVMEAELKNKCAELDKEKEEFSSIQAKHQIEHEDNVKILNEKITEHEKK